MKIESNTLVIFLLMNCYTCLLLFNWKTTLQIRIELHAYKLSKNFLGCYAKTKKMNNLV